MLIRRVFMFAVVLAGLISCGKKDEEEDEGTDCPETSETISIDAQEFAARYAEGYCDLRTQCLTEDPTYDDTDHCKQSTSRGQLDQACSGCDVNNDKVDACLEAAATINCEEWEDGWGGDDRKPIQACLNIWIGCEED